MHGLVSVTGSRRLNCYVRRNELVRIGNIVLTPNLRVVGDMEDYYG